LWRYYENSAQPESVVLELVPPRGMDAAETRQRVDAAVREIERAKQIEMRKNNRKFIGPKRIMEQDPYDNPTSWEKRRGRNPTFASRDKWARIEASQRKREWLEAYRDARDRYIAGDRSVEFPHGTWAMVQLHGCRCTAAG
jgi:hypothetical protein